jgi:ankyrin repeat protein
MVGNLDVDAKYDNRWTALHLADPRQHEEVVQLLEHKADVDTKALNFAAWNGHKAEARLLLKHRADVNAKNVERIDSAALCGMRQ